MRGERELRGRLHVCTLTSIEVKMQLKHYD